MRSYIKGPEKNNVYILAADASRGCVTRRLHTPGMRAPRALPGGRLDAQNANVTLFRALTAETADTAEKT